MTRGEDEMVGEPRAALRAQLGVTIVATLGGQRNRHWLVTARGERLILRRWSGPRDDADDTARRTRLAGRAADRRAER